MNKTTQNLPVVKNKADDYITHLAEQYDGKLLLRREIKLTDEQLNEALLRGLIKKISAVYVTFLKTKCNRCGNKDKTLFANVFCPRCEKDSTYCRHCIEMGRSMSCEFLYYYAHTFNIWKKWSASCTWDGRLNDYQLNATRKVLHNMTENKATLVWSVTGSGKTEMMFPVIEKALERGKRVCIATPRSDVVRELLPRCRHAFNDVPIQALYGGSKEQHLNNQFVIATTHQLIRYKHAFDLLIVDEVDAFPYDSDKTLVYVTDRSLKPNAMLVYLTATPRLKQKQLIFLKKLDYVFVPSRFHKNPLPVPQFVYVFNLQKQLVRNELPSQFYKWLIRSKYDNRQLLIFVPTISLSKKLLAKLTNQLINLSFIKDKSYITSVHAEDADRKEKIALFREKKIHVLVTTSILERGVTFPSVNVVVIDASHDIFDDAALIQIAGRAGRSVTDPKGDVLFFHDGKTKALVHARKSIILMNEKARIFKNEDDKDDMSHL